MSKTKPKKELIQTTRNKALTVNQDPQFYGSFAEIGAGQETARHFFQAGLASQTVAKSMSAYDKVFSDAIYGKGSRFVSEDRLLKMLDHEYKLLAQRLPDRVADTTFFAFANTVATSSHDDGAHSHAWFGLRFQTRPKGPSNDILIHVKMKDRLRLQQQEALGILGVNLTYAVRFLRDKGPEFVRSLLDNIGADRIEVEFIRFSGPDLKHIDNRLLSLELVKQNITTAILFDPSGNPLCPSDFLYGKAILVLRGTFRPVTTLNIQLIERGIEKLKKDFKLKKDDVVSFCEITMSNLTNSGNLDADDFLGRVDTIGSTGQHTMVSRFALYADLKENLRSISSKPIGITVGAIKLKELFDNKYYCDLKLGTMGAMAKLFDDNMRLYVFPFNTEESCITAKSFKPSKEMANIYRHFIESGHIADLDNCEDVDTSLHSEKVRKLMSKGDKSWEAMVPKAACDLIKKKKFFS